MKTKPPRAGRKTVTATGDAGEMAGAPEPILGLMVLATGQRFPFPPAKRWIVIGSARESDLVLADEHVSARHCLVERRGLERLVVHDAASKNGTRIDGNLIRIAELGFGAALSVGTTSLVAYTEQGPGGHTLDDFLRATVRVHGSIRKAATALGIPRKTLGDWLKRGRSKKLRSR